MARSGGGIIHHSQQKHPYAIQRLDQAPLNGTITNVIDWTPSAALQVGSGAVNRLCVERHGATVRLVGIVNSSSPTI